MELNKKVVCVDGFPENIEKSHVWNSIQCALHDVIYLTQLIKSYLYLYFISVFSLTNYHFYYKNS